MNEYHFYLFSRLCYTALPYKTVVNGIKIQKDGFALYEPKGDGGFGPFRGIYSGIRVWINRRTFFIGIKVKRISKY